MKMFVWRAWFFCSLALLLFCICVFSDAAFAVVHRAPEQQDWLDTVAALYGPTCGVLIALVVLCERIARVIPNSTDNQILKVLLLITKILGVKVPDNE